MKSAIVKRSIVIGGHKTSISLEEAFWQGLKEVAREQDIPLSSVVGEIDRSRNHGNLSSAIRLFVLERTRMLASSAAAGQSREPIPGEPPPREGARPAA